MTRTFPWRFALGGLLLTHGLAHAVLPMRGAGQLAVPSWLNAWSLGWSSMAIVGLTAAGAGLMGAPVMRRAWRGLAGLGLVASAAALVGFDDDGLWLGLLLDVALLAAVLRTPVQAPPRPGRSLPNQALRAAARAGLALFVAYVAAATMAWPWHRFWGTTRVERLVAMPGDHSPRTPALEVMHAVTIDAPASAVWPWLVQLGQDRAGFYSYDWLERLFQVEIRNVDRIHPEWQQRAAGDFVRATQPGYLGGLFGPDLGWRISHLTADRAMVLQNWGAFVLEPTPDGRTRLIVRSTISHPSIPVWAAAINFTAFEVPHFIMERRMLLGIKERAEAAPRITGAL